MSMPLLVGKRTEPIMIGSEPSPSPSQSQSHSPTSADANETVSRKINGAQARLFFSLRFFRLRRLFQPLGSTAAATNSLMHRQRTPAKYLKSAEALEPSADCADAEAEHFDARMLIDTLTELPLAALHAILGDMAAALEAAETIYAARLALPETLPKHLATKIISDLQNNSSNGICLFCLTPADSCRCPPTHSSPPPPLSRRGIMPASNTNNNKGKVDNDNAVKAIAGANDLIHQDSSTTTPLDPLEDDLLSSQVIRICGMALPTLPLSAFYENSKTVRFLDVSGNKLECVPPALGLLCNLESCVLRNNCLVSLPPELERLRSLRLLDVSGNRISNLDGKLLASISTLQCLDVRNNHLTTLPCDLCLLSQLRVLLLDGNPWIKQILPLVEPLFVGTMAMMPEKQMRAALRDYVPTSTFGNCCFVSQIFYPKNISHNNNINDSRFCIGTSKLVHSSSADEVLKSNPSCPVQISKRRDSTVSANNSRRSCGFSRKGQQFSSAGNIECSSTGMHKYSILDLFQNYRNGNVGRSKSSCSSSNSRKCRALEEETVPLEQRQLRNRLILYRASFAKLLSSLADIYDLTPVVAQSQNVLHSGGSPPPTHAASFQRNKQVSAKIGMANSVTAGAKTFHIQKRNQKPSQLGMMEPNVSTTWKSHHTEAPTAATSSASTSTSASTVVVSGTSSFALPLDSTSSPLSLVHTSSSTASLVANGGGSGTVGPGAVPGFFRSVGRSREFPKRLAIVAELLQTEETYTDELCFLINTYADTLATKRLLTPSESRCLFGSLEELAGFHRNLFHPALVAGREAPGRVFETHGARLAEVYTAFLYSYESAIEAFDTRVAASAKLRRALARLRATPGHRQIDMRSYFLLPVQRLPRYLLLLGALKGASDRLHADYASTCAALLIVERAVTDANECMRERSTRATIARVAARFADSASLAATLAQPHRRFVREANLCLAKAVYYIPCRQQLREVIGLNYSTKPSTATAHAYSSFSSCSSSSSSSYSPLSPSSSSCSPISSPSCSPSSSSSSSSCTSFFSPNYGFRLPSRMQANTASSSCNSMQTVYLLFSDILIECSRRPALGLELKNQPNNSNHTRTRTCRKTTTLPPHQEQDYVNPATLSGSGSGPVTPGAARVLNKNNSSSAGSSGNNNNNNNSPNGSKYKLDRIFSLTSRRQPASFTADGLLRVVADSVILYFDGPLGELDAWRHQINLNCCVRSAGTNSAVY